MTQPKEEWRNDYSDGQLDNDVVYQRGWTALFTQEDWWAVWLGAGFILVGLFGWVTSVPGIGRWEANPLDAIPLDAVLGLVALLIGLGLATGLAVASIGENIRRYWIAFPGLFLLTTVAYVLGRQETLAGWGVDQVIWGLVVGLVVSNTIGTPQWLRPALKSELFIKTGLVLLGATVLFNRILVLGSYGLAVAWIVTPIVLYFMYILGTRYLKIPSRELVTTVAATTSVCGVSAAIATGSAVRAKREEISFAISVSLIFTAIMIVGMPVLARLLGLNEFVAGAWIGGTVDATGAVVASAAILGDSATEVAAIIKMIQNVLIGMIAFVLAIIWVTRFEAKETGRKPSVLEIWYRFPKFILGFVGASLLFSFVFIPGLGQDATDDILSVANGFRNWLFALTFTAIGLQSNFVEMASLVRGGSPVVLYVVGQTFNILLTLLVAWVMFSGVFFPLPSV
jgi:uncharacterized integral membrane protein (TIGR00698 family)